jgi:hypothetical protein
MLAALLTLILAADPAIPAPLAALESTAEELDEAAAVEDWKKVEELAKSASISVAKVAAAHARHPAAPELKKALAAVKAAAKKKDGLSTRKAANRLAGVVIDFYLGYETKVPADVMRLDVILKEVELCAVASKPGDAAAAVARLDATWARLSGKSPVDGSPAKEVMEEHLAQLAEAIEAKDVKEIEIAATLALEGVDELEKLFE